MGTHNKKQKSKFGVYSKFGSCGALAVGIVGATGTIEHSAQANAVTSAPFISLTQDFVKVNSVTSDMPGKTAHQVSSSHHEGSGFGKRSLGEIQRNIGVTFNKVKPAIASTSHRLSSLKEGISHSATVIWKDHHKIEQHLIHNTPQHNGLNVHPGSGVAAHVPAAGLAKGMHMAAVRAALTRIGRPYAWGAMGPNAFDCSGLVAWSYQQVGVTLPRNTWGQLSTGVPVRSVDDLQPGDLIIYVGGTHVGMYIGNGLMIHSPEDGRTVEIAPVASQSIYTMRRVQASN